MFAVKPVEVSRMLKVLHLIFFVYRIFISPVVQLIFGIQCRYQETCSRYTERAVQEKGVFKGIFLGFNRILSCNSIFRSSHGQLER